MPCLLRAFEIPPSDVVPAIRMALTAGSMGGELIGRAGERLPAQLARYSDVA